MINRFQKKLQQKWKSKHGATLSEMLITLAIMALVAASMTAGINASMRVYNQSLAYSESQTLSSTISQTIIDELRYAQDIQITDDALVTFTSANRGSNVSFGQSAEGYITLGDALLITEGAYSSGNFNANVDVTYDKEHHLFHVTLTITEAAASSDKNSASSVDTVQTVTFSVKPLNTVKS